MTEEQQQGNGANQGDANGGGTNQESTTNQVTYQPVHPTGQPHQSQPYYAEGCLKAGWNDLKNSPDFAGRMGILGLINCVPILNFVVGGYFLNWSREVPYGQRTPLPKEIVTSKNFEFGFYQFVIGLIVGIAASVVSLVCGIIPLIGSLLGMAVVFAFAILQALMEMRMVLAQNLGGAFKLENVWEVAQRNIGQLLMVTLVPQLILSFISFVLVSIMSVVGIGMLVGGGLTIATLSDADTLLSTLSLLAGPLVIFFIIALVVSAFAGAIINGLSYRGLGHWVGRYAPEWTALAPFSTIPYEEPLK
jgi:hypothetical protein